MTKRLLLLVVLAVLTPVASVLGCGGVESSAENLDAGHGGGVLVDAGHGGNAPVDAGNPDPCVSGDARCPTSCTAESDSDCRPSGVDVSGVWFSKLSAPGSLKVDGELENEATIGAWIRLYVSPTGGLTLNVCRLSVTGESRLSTTYPPPLIKTLQASAQLSEGTSVPIGGAVKIPSFTIYSGQTSTGTAVDAPPPTFPAGDGDGKLGVTIPGTLTVASVPTDLDIYAGLVITTDLSGLTLTEASTITGKANFKTQGVVFGSTNAVLVDTGMKFEVTTTPTAVSFTATKLDSDGSHDCAYIAGQ